MIKELLLLLLLLQRIGAAAVKRLAACFFSPGNLGTRLKAKILALVRKQDHRAEPLADISACDNGRCRIKRDGYPSRSGPTLPGGAADTRTCTRREPWRLWDEACCNCLKKNRWWQPEEYRKKACEHCKLRERESQPRVATGKGPV